MRAQQKTGNQSFAPSTSCPFADRMAAAMAAFFAGEMSEADARAEVAAAKADQAKAMADAVNFN